MLTVLFSRTDEKGILAVLKLFIAAGVLLAFYIIFVELFPEVYFERILPALPESIADYALELHEGGYGVTVGGSIVYADYVMILGFLALLTSFLFRKGSRLLRSTGRRITALLVMLLFLAAIYIEGRRGEMLCLIGASAIVFLLSIQKHRIREKRRKKCLFILAGAAIVLVFAALIVLGSDSRFMSTFQKIINNIASGENRDITSGRINRWNRALDLFRTSPVFGIGWGRYANHFYPGQYVSDVVSVKINFKYVHNDILNILCEMGVAGLILTVLPLLYIFVKSLRQNRRLMRSRQEIPAEILRLNLFSLGIQIFWILLGLIDPVFYKQFFLCYYAFAICIQDTALRMETEFRAHEAVSELSIGKGREELVHGVA